MRLAGIDLAWKSDRNPSVAAFGDLEGSILTLNRIETNLRGLDIMKSLFEEEKDVVGVAIDGPLIIPNMTGQRACERELTRDYIRFGVGCHSTNLHLYPEAGSTELSAYLEDKGFKHLGRVRDGKFQIECYPHPSLIEIFGLSERLRYKKGTLLQKKEGQVKLTQYLQELRKSRFVSLFMQPRLSRYFDNAYIGELHGMSLKQNEDILDAIVCLYVSAMYARQLPYRVYGLQREGYIYVPNQRCVITDS
jgi:predicted RNase H-like nuclease